MKRTNQRQLKVNRVTLRRLDGTELGTVNGGGTLATRGSICESSGIGVDKSLSGYCADSYTC